MHDGSFNLFSDYYLLLCCFVLYLFLIFWLVDNQFYL